MSDNEMGRRLVQLTEAHRVAHETSNELARRVAESELARDEWARQCNLKSEAYADICSLYSEQRALLRKLVAAYYGRWPEALDEYMSAARVIVTGQKP